LAAKSVNAIPSLDPAEKPESESYRNHVNGLMAISWNFLPMLTNFSKIDRNAAADLSGRIEKKEVRIFGDFVVGVASLEAEEKPEPKSAQAAIEN
jgi:hypothetical protein